MRLRSPIALLRRAWRQLIEIDKGQTTISDWQAEIVERQSHILAEQTRLRTEMQDAFARQLDVLRAIYDDEPGSRLRLWAIRADQEYLRPFEEANPLVTVLIPTYSNARDLAARSIPSVLAQTHDNLEVLVVGDAAGPEIEDAVSTFDDPRLRYVNLTIRGPYPPDPVDEWFIAGTGPMNEGLRLAAGQWIATNTDDDAFAPNHVESLLDEARRRHLEIVYGRIRQIDPQGGEVILGIFPPNAAGHFGVQAALLHRGLRLFPRELVVFGDPGDWAWVRRMIRLGVRIGMIDDVVVDYYPSNMWGTPSRPHGTLDDWRP